MSTILLVEDSKFLRVANERLLIEEGYQVIGAGDGEEALLIARAKLPDLIVLDMLLPKLSGHEVLQLLKSNTKTNHIPVIVLSGMPRKIKQGLMREGASAFLEKGGLLKNPQPLLDVISRTLAQSAAEAVDR